MARPKRQRRICREPAYVSFLPVEGARESVQLTLDEYEVIRLVDYEKMTHAECAVQMEVARSTVTEIYESARYKLADAIIHGKALRIGRGQVKLCPGDFEACLFDHCWREERGE